MLTENQRQALKLYADYKLTLIQAADKAEIGFFDFQMLLRDQEIPQHYTVEDLEQDLKNIRRLK
jgi:predicted HTH domain antitoxin